MFSGNWQTIKAGDTYKLEAALDKDNLYFRLQSKSMETTAKMMQTRVTNQDFKNSAVLRTVMQSLSQLFSSVKSHPYHVLFKNKEKMIKIIAENPLNKDKELELANLPLSDIKTGQQMEQVLKDCKQQEDLSGNQIKTNFAKIVTEITELNKLKDGIEADVIQRKKELDAYINSQIEKRLNEKIAEFKQLIAQKEQADKLKEVIDIQKTQTISSQPSQNYT